MTGYGAIFSQFKLKIVHIYVILNHLIRITDKFDKRMRKIENIQTIEPPFQSAHLPPGPKNAV